MSTYTRSLVTDLSGSLNVEQLRDELTALFVGIDCDSVVNFGDVVSITMSVALSVGEISTMDTAIGNHIAVVSGAVTATNNILSSSTLITFVSAVSMTTSYLRAGSYRVAWSYAFKTDSGTPDIRVVIDSATTVHANNVAVPVINNVLEYTNSGSTVVTLAASTHDITLEYRGNGSTVTIVRSELSLVPV